MHFLKLTLLFCCSYKYVRPADCQRFHRCFSSEMICFTTNLSFLSVSQDSSVTLTILEPLEAHRPFISHWSKPNKITYSALCTGASLTTSISQKDILSQAWGQNKNHGSAHWLLLVKVEFIRAMFGSHIDLYQTPGTENHIAEVEI